MGSRTRVADSQYDPHSPAGDEQQPGGQNDKANGKYRRSENSVDHLAPLDRAGKKRMNGAAAVAWQRPRWRNQRTVLFAAAPASDAKQAALVQKFSSGSEEKLLFRFTEGAVALC
jgi:hypothetical protein